MNRPPAAALSPSPRSSTSAPELRPRFGTWLGAGIVAALACAVLTANRSREVFPPMRGTLNLQLTLPAGVAGHTEPIVITGMYGEGDLVVLRYIDEKTAEFAYDHWGFGGPRSERVTFEPNSRHTLELTLPSLTTYHKPPADARGLVRVAFDGREILRGELHYHGRLPKQVYFGENPIGGSASRAFRGTIARADGHVVRGGPESYFTLTERAGRWMRTKRNEAFGVLAASLAIGAVCLWLFRQPWLLAALARSGAATRAFWHALRAGEGATSVPLPSPGICADGAPAAALPPAQPWLVRHGWLLGCTLFAAIGYAWLVTLGTFNFNCAEVFGSFYDYQAASFLQGRLDVPEEAIGGEAFEANGKLYGYFGPTPALLRLPFVACGLAFGKLSRAFMLLYFIASLGAAYLLLRDAAKLARRDPHAAPAEPSAFAVLVMVGSVGFASTIFFLGSRGLIFHEAILAGIAFSLWSCWCALRHLQTPARRWWVAALVLGVLSLHARPPTGLFALTLLGSVVVALALRDTWHAHGELRSRVLRSRLRRHAGVALLCFAGLLTLNGLAYLKFKTFDPAPLRISRPYQNNGRLAHIDGKSFHTANLPYNFYTYVLRPNFRLERGFPWIYLTARTPPRGFPGAKIDLPDHTLAMPYAMPSLFLLATLGGLGALLAVPRVRWPIVVIWAAGAPLTLALFAAVATAQRYTGDFCPLLISGAAFGLAACEVAPKPWRWWLRSLTAFATAAGIAVTVAITLHYQGATLWGVPPETQQNYEALRRRVDAFFGYTAPPHP